MYYMTKVKIVSGTTSKSCSCGSWLEHWDNFSNEKAILCSAKLCLERQLVGTHVKKVYHADNAQYIIPLCQLHDLSDKMIEISGNYILVSADPKVTCVKAK
jgi:hypothetical protein